MTNARKSASTAAKDGLEGVYVKGLDQAAAYAKEQVEKAAATFLKGVDDARDYGRENIDAVVKSNAAAAKGFEELGRAWFAFAQGQADQGVSVTRAMMTAASLREVVDLQSGYAKTAFDSFLAEGARFSELSVKLTSEAVAPLSERVNATVEKFAKPLAA